MKIGTHPMRTRLPLFLDWGIAFGKKPSPDTESWKRKVYYASRQELTAAILEKYPPPTQEDVSEPRPNPMGSGGPLTV